MKKFLVVAAAMAALMTPVAASADDREGWRDRNGDYREYRDYRSRRNTDRVVGAIIGGVLGAIVGAEAADRGRYRERDYYYDGDGYYYYDRRGGGDYRHGYENYNRYGWRDRRDSRYYR